jgi:thiol-disulfide isomerase/thioredoxin
MGESIDHNRRHFLSMTAMTMGIAQFGILDPLEANERTSRQLAALGSATEWLNSPPLPAMSLRERVVLVQFGTYTCINWLRTLPHIRAWAQRYGPGLTVIGVHTPEFAFEKNLENVRRAVQQLKIGFPLALDNEYAIWRAFNNHYWPAVYLEYGTAGTAFSIVVRQARPRSADAIIGGSCLHRRCEGYTQRHDTQADGQHPHRCRRSRSRQGVLHRTGPQARGRDDSRRAFGREPDRAQGCAGHPRDDADSRWAGH